MKPSTPPEAGSPATLWLWAGQAIYRGPSLRLDAHSTAVDCLAVGVDAPFTLAADGIARTVRSALIPPRRVHRVVAGGDHMMFCYLDPRSPGARACRDRMTLWDNDFGLNHRQEAALVIAAAHDRPEARSLADLVGSAPRPPLDERVAEAMATLLAHPAHEFTAERFAAAAHLSESRFLHLFAAQAGTSFRRYRRWARMLGVGRAIAKGQNITVASTDAGFASPSHFSDAFHALFGLSATALLATGVRIVVLDEAEGIEPEA
ncbi:AraC family transcriptional regulator [Nocardia sp. NBC_00508]|uniref:helix-turn-helix domain-containing protein n=1 Tax=Nocardia sp. NBC_00508 TaxID=2975992 RepID=UPI002E8245D0|nr:AraC family transcriptional regulator [Nocardia sp. NBC_00508]WUD68093.1 AraC family transcriptional regulator [Nocardia sp. NBC_00508]